MNIKEIFKTSWTATKKNWVFLILVAIVFVVINGVHSYLMEHVPETSFFVSLIFMLLSVFLQVGLVKALLDLSAHKEVHVSQLFASSNYVYFWKYILGGIAYGLMVAVGLILLIIPGVMIAITYSQWQYLLIDKNLGIKEAFKKSAEMTRGKRLDIFYIGLLLIGIFILSIIPLGLGLLLSIPLSMVVPVYIYRTLDTGGVSVEGNTNTASEKVEGLEPFTPLS